MPPAHNFRESPCHRGILFLSFPPCPGYLYPSIPFPPFATGPERAVLKNYREVIRYRRRSEPISSQDLSFQRFHSIHSENSVRSNGVIMKKFLVFLALALLVVSGTGYAVTCAYDNVPAATLLVPYWTVSMNQLNPALPASPFKDTLVGIVNVSAPGVIAHITVWNKYSKAVLDFNVPLTGKDVAYFRMSDILKGKLNVNANMQTIPGIVPEPCGIDLSGVTPLYIPDIGWGQTQFIRFSNPDANLAAGFSGDAYGSLSQYADPAYPAFQAKVWDSLDESGDITFDDAVTNIIDTDNPACTKPASGASDGVFSGNFSGYLLS